MTLNAISLDHPRALTLGRSADLICFALCVAHVVFLAAAFALGVWLVDPQGQAIQGDFVNVWAGGAQASAGDPSAAYDPQLHKQAMEAAVGHSFAGSYPWLYPPTFLFVAVAAATIPYVPAFAAWVFLTFPLYALTIRGIIGHRTGYVLAAAFPAVLSNAMAGQNGFVTAALIGGALLTMERRPLLAGCLIGLLSFKPHFGILFPLILIAGGHWRTFASAAATTTLLAAASWLAFGADAWIAFLHALPVASHESLTEGLAQWLKLQSLFGLVRTFGGSETLAWTLQLLLTGVVAIMLCALWRKTTVAFDMKAAALATAIPLVTPYIFIYDLVVLAIPMAFLIRAGLRTRPLPLEFIGIGAASALILIFPAIAVPVGFPAAIIVAVLVARRVVAGNSSAARSWSSVLMESEPNSRMSS